MEKQKIKKIHITLPEELHQKLRVKTALEDLSIQKYVENLIEQSLRDVNLEVLQGEK
jgi:predicted HicB family RNase H-like nuclease